MRIHPFIGALLALGVATGAAAGPAASQRSVSLVLSSATEQHYTDEKGQKATRLVPVGKIVPGDEVVYTIEFTNGGTAPADKVVITDPLPPEVVYKDGSAFGAGTEIEFSADGGKTWGKPAALKAKGADGKERPAVAADYTHVRWKLLGPVAPGQKGFVRFRAVLK